MGGEQFAALSMLGLLAVRSQPRASLVLPDHRTSFHLYRRSGTAVIGKRSLTWRRVSVEV